MTIALSTRLASRFEDAVACTREALAQNGFGVLTEIRIAETLKATLSVPLEDYLILGACNLELAYQAISVDREIGLLLPCNVVVRADPGDPDTVIVEGWTLPSWWRSPVNLRWWRSPARSRKSSVPLSLR